MFNNKVIKFCKYPITAKSKHFKFFMHFSTTQCTCQVDIYSSVTPRPFYEVGKFHGRFVYFTGNLKCHTTCFTKIAQAKMTFIVTNDSSNGWFFKNTPLWTWGKVMNQCCPFPNKSKFGIMNWLLNKICCKLLAVDWYLLLLHWF